jgi:hypothetical protein
MLLVELYIVMLQNTHTRFENLTHASSYRIISALLSFFVSISLEGYMPTPYRRLVTRLLAMLSKEHLASPFKVNRTSVNCFY